MHTLRISTLIVVLLVHTLSAYVVPIPIPPTPPSHMEKRQANSAAVAQLTGMLSNANACPASTGECVTPADALTPIINGLARYKVNTAAEQAAVVSLMAFESVDFKYNHNISPGRPGQGTRAMMMPNFVRKYVDSLPELQAAAAAAGTDVTKILALVQDDAHSFAAASWFYSTQCSEGVKSQVQTGSKAGWAAYISGCVGTTVTAEREAYWRRACQQLGVSVS